MFSPSKGKLKKVLQWLPTKDPIKGKQPRLWGGIQESQAGIDREKENRYLLMKAYMFFRVLKERARSC